MGASERKKNRKISNKISSKWRNHVVICNIITSGFSIYLLLIHCIGKSFIMICHSSCPCHRLFMCECVCVLLSSFPLWLCCCSSFLFLSFSVCACVCFRSANSLYITLRSHCIPVSIYFYAQTSAWIYYFHFLICANVVYVIS